MAGAFSSAFSSAFDIGSATPAVLTDTHDGFGRLTDRQIRALYRRAEKARKAEDDRKEEERRQLVEAVHSAFDKVFGIAEAPSTATVRTFQPAEKRRHAPEPEYTPDWSRIGEDLAEIQRVIALIEQQSRLAIQAEMQDEEDIAAILMAA